MTTNRLGVKIGSIILSGTLVTTANAYEIYSQDGKTLDLYGQLAGSIVNYSDNHKGSVFESESRLGIRVSNALDNGLMLIGQIEGGNVDAGDKGELGLRDTYIGVKGAFGKVRVGRMLTPLYEMVDWPYSNPGLGRVFDWGGSVASNYDRQSNQIRYDSPNYNGLTYAVSIGRDAPDRVSGNATKDSYFYGANVNYSINKMITLKAAIENAKKFKGENEDTFTYLLGFDSNFGGGWSLKAAYKHRRNENDGLDVKQKQGSYSVIGQYAFDKYAFRLGYAENFKSRSNGHKNNDDEKIVSFQPMYITNGVTFYGRFAHHMKQDGGKDNIFRVGFEYPF